MVVDRQMPDWMRATAHDVGLPIESPQLVEARAELERLGNALAQADRAEVAAADAEMVRLVKSLSAAERRKIEPVAHEVHLRAVEFLAQPAR
jgi:hypothetical protein